MSDFINIISNGGSGDLILSIRLKHLLNQIYPNWDINNYLCCRDEVWNMIKTVYPYNDKILKLEENFLESIKNQNDLNNFDEMAQNYIIYPDKLFRGIGAPPLKKWNITNFLIKQTRTLLGQWKPENYISLAINSITPGYTYHSVPELAIKLAKSFPDNKIYLPLLISWNNKSVPKFNFPNPPENLIIDVNPEFRTVFEILCKSEYLISTDNAIMHIAYDLGMPHLVLDPQFNQSAFEARWRTSGFFHSVPINALAEDIVNVVKTQITIPETQMLGIDKIYRKNINWAQELIFKE